MIQVCLLLLLLAFLRPAWAKLQDALSRTTRSVLRCSNELLSNIATSIWIQFWKVASIPKTLFFPQFSFAHQHHEPSHPAPRIIPPGRLARLALKRNSAGVSSICSFTISLPLSFSLSVRGELKASVHAREGLKKSEGVGEKRERF